MCDEVLHNTESHLTSEEIESDSYDADLSADDLFKMVFVPDEDL